MTGPGLSLERLSVSRGNRRVLHEVSLRVGRGEVVALLGANGSGKSTLVMASIGALPAQAGSVTLNGSGLNGLGPARVRKRGVAVVPEGHRVLDRLSVADNLKVAAAVLASREVGGAVDDALALFPELKPHLPTAAGRLSGGQKQMVAIAQALVSRPKILLVDELSLGLSPAIKERLATALRTLAGAGLGVLVIEQFTALALSMAHRAYVLSLGRITYDGPAQKLVQEPSLLEAAYFSHRDDGDKTR